MHHTGTLPLQTQRLLLRPFILDDCQAAFSAWFGDKRVMDWMREKPHRDWTVTAELLALWQQQSESNPRFYCWAIQRRQDGALLGFISLAPAEDRDLWEPGFCLGVEYQGHGYAAEALRAVCRHWFLAVEGQLLSACHMEGNIASGHVLRAAGFRYTHSGIQHRFDGTPVTCCFYLLKKENFVL